MALANRQDVRKEVRYINKDFSSLRKSLINYAKTYFPSTYNDFNESSPGMMFIEMAAYVGDVLSYYVDSQFKEMLLGYAEERKNIITLAQTFGYKPKVSVGGATKVDMFQIVPSIGSGDNWSPDLRYGLIVKEGMAIGSADNPEISFRTVEDANFKFSSSFEPMEVSIYETSNFEPARYLLKKEVKVVAGNIAEETFEFTAPEKFAAILLSRDDIIEILNVYDSDGNKWYEVPYLAQDTMFVDVENSATYDPELSQYNDTAPYMLKLKKTPRRFITRIREDNTIELQFGSGVSASPDEVLVPSPANIANEALSNPISLEQAYDPSNFLKTKTYGQVPHTTTLTVKYSYGGGVHTNIQANTLTEVKGAEFEIDEEGLNADTVTTAKNSIAIINPEPATGGKSSETLDEIRHNALAFFAAQNRCVTKEDYVVRAYSMPPKYGSVAKAYIVQDEQLNQSNFTRSTKAEDKKDIDNQKRAEPTIPSSYIPNPLALNLYTLGYDADKKLTKLSPAVKENLKLYLGQYRILTDAVNIKNAYIINISVEFDIVALREFNDREVLLRCVKTIKDYFEIDNWQINQPISIGDLIYEVGLVEGVQTVKDIIVKNLWDENLGYSGNVYDIDEALRNKTLYPSMDPSIFEIRFPSQDIKGQVTAG